MHPLIFTLCMSLSGGCTAVTQQQYECLMRHHVDAYTEDNDPEGTDQRVARKWVDRRVVALWPHECQLGANK
jgi:hypothetical protein